MSARYHFCSGTGAIVSSVALPDKGADDGTETYALIHGEYQYTTTPTPGAANVYTEPIRQEDKLKALNEAGENFFRVDNASTFSKVVDISISVPEEGMDIIENHPAWEQWVLFDEFSVSNIPANTSS